MQGKGVFKWADGRVYEGQFVKDNKEGEGEMHWPDGRRYIGQWKQGTLSYFNSFNYSFYFPDNQI